jgi:hypothetical protein
MRKLFAAASIAAILAVPVFASPASASTVPADDSASLLDLDSLISNSLNDLDALNDVADLLNQSSVLNNVNVEVLNNIPVLNGLLSNGLL